MVAAGWLAARPPLRCRQRALSLCKRLGTNLGNKAPLKGNAMAWTTPTLVEICIGLEINGYLPAEF